MESRKYLLTQPKKMKKNQLNFFSSRKLLFLQPEFESLIGSVVQLVRMSPCHPEYSGRVREAKFLNKKSSLENIWIGSSVG
jgi:hypothetical protein